MRLKRKILIGLLAMGTVVLLTIAFHLHTAAYNLLSGEWPGGMRSDYPAHNGDPRLTREARTALPIIEALRKYKSQYGAYPDKIEKLHILLPQATIQNGVEIIDDWWYFHQPEMTEFVVSKKLGWDPMLNYESEGENGHWIFDPGDGTEPTILKLNP